MADVVIVQESPEQSGTQEHCPECERKFAEIEKRLAAIEQHHPVMDANTEEAQETAEEALEVAEEALEMATEAVASDIVEALEVAEEVTPPPEVEEEIIEEEARGEETFRNESSGSGEETPAEPGGESAAQGEAVVIAIEPEPERKPAATKPAAGNRDTGLRFHRGGKRRIRA